MKNVRYALLDKPGMVHRTYGDETRMTVCGVIGASLILRFSRRAATHLRGRSDCLRCASILESRSR